MKICELPGCGKEVLKPTARFCQLAGHRTGRPKNPDATLQCAICGNDFVVPFTQRKTKKTCTVGVNGSDTCRAKLRLLNIDIETFGAAISNGRLEADISYPGHPHSQELKDRWSVERSDGRMCGKNNGMFGRKHRDDSREAMSLTKTQKMINGEYDKSKFSKKGEVFATKANKTISYRSMWELKAIELLETDANVVSFKFECVRIPYVYGIRNDGTPQIRHYVPDFIITFTNNSMKMVEVKPNCYVNSAMNVAKASAAREYCREVGMTYEFWTQDILFPNGKK